jgi:Rod binding domain-containing protein
MKLPAEGKKTFSLERKTPTGTLTPEEREKKLKKATESFETYFLYTLLKTMQRGIAGTSKGLEQSTFNEMFDQKIAEKIAEKGGIGIGDVLERDIRAKVLNRTEADHRKQEFFRLQRHDDRRTFHLK